MPRKLEFTVLSCSSDDLKYRSTELNAHGPTVRGWQSERNCDYPQEVVLQLTKRSSLCKIQFLVHQFLIPSKIELFCSNEDTNTVTHVEEVAWDYLGYITLSDNESSNFKSRELKSAKVPNCKATFLKLKLSKNHENAFNIHNQVSLIAINILGLETETTAEPHNSIQIDPEYFSPYDDLAFDMYVDTEVAKIIRNMEIKKHTAVSSERFEYARKLKLAMEQLRVAGERLGKYELEKRHAIEHEDYERARLKKNQSDEFRTSVYEQIGVEQLLEVNGECSKNDECVDETAPNSPTLLKTPVDRRSVSPCASHLYHGQVSPLHVPRHQSPKRDSPKMGSPTSIQTRGSFRRRNKSAGAITKSTYEQYEEKPLPALRHSQTNEFLRECQMEVETKVTSKLTEREKKQAALPILVFGNELIEEFYSKQYLDKEDGLNKLKEELITYDNTRTHTANKTARAAIFLLHRALRDKVFSVYSLANEVIRLFFVQFVPGRVTTAEVSRSVDKILPELLTKSGDTSARIHHMAVHTILSMADCKSVRDLHIIPVHLSRPVSSSTHPRLALSRAEMVEQLIVNHGISTDKQSGLTCRTLSEFGSSCLHHPAEAVRKVAERILVLVYKVNPRLVRKQLPPDDDITRRNLLYRQLFHEFDKIDVQRKNEMLEKNRLIQQVSSLPCLSPEPNVHNDISKTSISTVKLNGHKKLASPQNSNENGRQSTSSASGVSSPSNAEDEKLCIFCHQTEQSILAVNNSMNSHYWRSCPMLVRCKECSQVVEVSNLTEHLLTECEHRERYTQCPQCTESVVLSAFEAHVRGCSELSEGNNRCPLCHSNFEVEVLSWKKHLMGDQPCLMNTRIKSQVQKQVTIKT